MLGLVEATATSSQEKGLERVARTALATEGSGKARRHRTALGRHRGLFGCCWAPGTEGSTKGGNLSRQNLPPCFVHWGSLGCGALDLCCSMIELLVAYL